MKKILMILAFLLSATAAAAFADAKLDFNAQCASCHRANKSILKKARMLNVEPEKLALMASKMSREEMIAVTEKGKNKMPAFENVLGKDRIAAVIDYILSFKNRKR